MTMTPGTGTDAPDRRQGDRRKADRPFAGPDRREAERRSGRDRRTSPRS